MANIPESKAEAKAQYMTDWSTGRPVVVRVAEVCPNCLIAMQLAIMQDHWECLACGLTVEGEA